MKKFKFYVLSFSLITLMCFLLTGCSDNDDSNNGTSRVMVRMTDAPGDYDAVNIDVQDIMMKASTDTGDEGWVSIKNNEFTPGVYNLLDLTGGVNILLADNIVPSGYLGQIRLVLGTNNTVVKNGVTYPLNTPSAQQSGLKLNVNQTLVGGVIYEFLLDFDVEHSIVVQAGGSGNYNLHPVIRVSTEATSGVIKGRISPVLTGYQVLASVQVGDTTVSAYADEAGLFQLNGIPAGTYTVTLTPETGSGKAVKTITGVVVVNGEIKDIGDVTLVALP